MKPNTMTKDFRLTPPVQKSRSMFNLSKRNVITLDSGYLVPVYSKQVYPGDTFYFSARHMTRLLSPTKNLIMDNIKIDLHCFFADYRILWHHWEEFMGERLVPTVAPSVQLPQITLGAYDVGVIDTRVLTHSLSDYLGFPVGEHTTMSYGTAGIAVALAPYRMYNQTYNWFYRDQDITAMAPEFYESHGVDITESLASYPLRLRQKPKDYFTSARPWPQKGPDVLLPLASSAPVYGNGGSLQLITDDTATALSNRINLSDDTDAATRDPGVTYYPAGTAAGAMSQLTSTNTMGVVTAAQVAYDIAHGVNSAAVYGSGLYADLSGSVAGTINGLRLAWAMQMALETDALYGTRYPDHLLGHFGVTLHDTAYKPEYLGGGTDFMQFVPVTSTVEFSGAGTTPQGYQTAFGVGSGNLGGFTFTSESYGWIMAILSFTPDISYSQGIPRDYLHNDRFDFYLPELANIGEQPIYNCELYVDTVQTNHFLTFGYQEPWAFLRFDFNSMAGLMRPICSAGFTSLYQYHFSEVLHDPALNTQFLEHDPTIIDRAIAVTSQPQFLCDLYFDVKAARVLPAFPSRTRLGGI